MINRITGDNYIISEELEIKPEGVMEATNFSSVLTFDEIGRFVADVVADLRSGEYFIAVLPTEVYDEIEEISRKA